MGFGSLLRKRLMGWEYIWFDVVVGNSTGHEEVGPRLVMVLKGDHDDGWVTDHDVCIIMAVCVRKSIHFFCVWFVVYR